MTEKTEAASMILRKKILTPILYVIEQPTKTDFICFCDKNIKINELRQVSEELSRFLNTPVEIIDIREFSVSDRIEVLQNAKMVFSEHPVIEQILVSSIAEDFKENIKTKVELLERYNKTGSHYLQ